MADVRATMPVFDPSGVLITSVPGGASVIARSKTGAVRTAPPLTYSGIPGVCNVTPTDDDEASGTVVVVDFGAGYEPRRVTFAVYQPSNLNQFWAFSVENPDSTTWSGAAPTVGGYRSAAGARVAPSLVAVESTWLFVAVPTEADIAADTHIRVDGPAGSAVDYWSGSTESPGGVGVASSPGVTPETLVITALREYLLRYLPAKCAQLNPLRKAVLKSALAEPFVVPSGAKLRLTTVSQEATPTDVTLPSGAAVAAAAIAAAINLAAPPGGVAGADEAGRVTWTSNSAPASGVPSVALVARDIGPTGGNTALGWAEGGEHVEVAGLVAPSWRGVTDGRPLTVPDMGQGFWVMFGNRTSRPTHEGIRRDTHLVTVQTEVWRPFSANAPPHRSRETVSSCVRAVRELLLTSDGRYLGRQRFGDVQLANVSEAVIAGDPLRLNEAPGVLFETARLTITVRVFQRPD
ncbi:MAG: hypothetical protein JNM17_04120 [Archangium sp.]|nr:hypothetical protein [Archangium sp.]